MKIKYIILSLIVAMQSVAVCASQKRPKQMDKPAVYVNKVFLNGKPYTKSYLKWTDVKEGAHIHFVMSTKPNKKWATQPQDIAPSLSAPGKTMTYQQGKNL